LVVALQGCVIILLFARNSIGECQQTWMTEILGQAFFCDGAADAAIAVFERVDTDKVEMGDACTGQRRQRRFSIWRSVVEPFYEAMHLVGHVLGPWGLEVDNAFVARPRHPLHGIFMNAIAAYGTDIASALHQRAMPG